MAKAPKKTPGKPGRVSTFNAKDAAEIVARLSKGEPLTVICRDEWMPHDNTVRNWMEADAAFAGDIARARETGFDAIAAECLAIADQPNKRVTTEGEITENDPQRDRLRVDTRLKLLAKWDPKRYGDKVALTGGGDGDKPIEIVVNYASNDPG